MRVSADTIGPEVPAMLLPSIHSFRANTSLAMVYHGGAWLLGEIRGRILGGYVVYVRRLHRSAYYLADQVLPMGS